MTLRFAAGLLIVITAGAVRGQPEPIEKPAVLRPDLALDLFAREPDIVTPVAIDVDPRGRVWVIESNTHFPKPDYGRHPSDRILILEDADGDGGAERIRVFTDGLEQSMSLALRDEGRRLLLATRREVMAFEDPDGDGHPDSRSTIARLETAEQYPHNGLSGFAFDREGWVYFAIGENMGIPYRLTGTDGSSVAAGPDGGSIFRMRPDGTRLERWAFGFWNTFHMAFDPRGRLFAVDNDPDSRPPCRLLHIVRGGDYGYRRWLGRKGLHPFTSWNGEVPGTLPMVSGTGEAPSGIVAYEGAGLPQDLRGKLIITSWGDHRIEVHAPEPRGASFRSQPVPIVRGGEMFRPVGIAAAPDGSLYFSDWVDKDYHVHSKGRIWRLRPSAAAGSGAAGSSAVAREGAPRQDSIPRSAPPAPSLAATRLEILLALGRQGPDFTGPSVVFDLLAGDRDPFLEGAAADALVRVCGTARLLESRRIAAPDRRLLVLLALRRTRDPLARAAVADFLSDPDLAVRRAAIQWVGEEKLEDQRQLLEKALEAGPVSRPIFDAWLAAMSLLAGEAPDARDTVASDDFLLALARDARRPAGLRTLALRSVSAAHAGLTLPVLKEILAAEDPGLRTEAVRALASSSLGEASALLQAIARTGAEPASARRAAIAGLAGLGEGAAESLGTLQGSDHALVRREAERALRLRSEKAAERGPLSVEERASVLSGGDPTEGEIIFSYPRGPRCSSCHAVRGRGGAAGPDLSAAGYTPRAKLLESILEPGKEIAPQYATWVMVTREGPRMGTIVREDLDGALHLAEVEGTVRRLPVEEIVTRSMAQTSLMPEGLAGFVTLEELRDLLAFLESLR